jgi:hypothetical protein
MPAVTARRGVFLDSAIASAVNAHAPPDSDGKAAPPPGKSPAEGRREENAAVTRFIIRHYTIRLGFVV